MPTGNLSRLGGEPTVTARVSIWKGWWPECGFCICGYATFTVIVVVLRMYDQKQRPTWPLDITLNAFLALLSTTSKASFMISIAESISQWKWNIYNNTKGRIIHDFEVVDLASRGFWGSCWLIGRFRWRHPISLAGVISIASVLTSPITQQALTFPTRPVGDEGRGKIHAAIHWNPSRNFQFNIAGEKSIINGLQSSPDIQPVPLVASCPTANCSFKKYLSLAVCAKVKDVSQFLNISTIASGEGGFKDNSHTRTYSAALPNGIHLRTTATYSLWTQPGNASSLSFNEDAGYPAALANHFIIHSRAADNDSSPFSPESTDKTRRHQHQQPEFGALEVLIYMCINEYDTSVKEGKSRTQQRTLSSSLLKDEQGRIREIPKLHCPTLRSGSDTVDCIMPSTYNSQEASTNLSFAPGIDQNQEYANYKNTKESFSFSFGTALTISRSLNSLMQGMVTWEKDGGNTKRDGYSVLWLKGAIYGRDRDIINPEKQLERVQAYFDGLATQMTNHIRSKASTEPIPGTAWREEVYVHVRWGWLGFLAGEVVLSTIFVIFTIVATRRSCVPILKSSATATLLALDRELQDSLGTAADIHDADCRVKQVYGALKTGVLVRA